MKRSSAPILLFLALLLSWGQVLAAPFLPCHHELAGSGAAQVATQHAGHHHADMAEPQHAHGAVAVAALSHDQAVHAASDCDPDCRLHCLTLVTPALPALPLLASAAAPVAHGMTADALPPAQPPAAHFRPPQQA